MAVATCVFLALILFLNLDGLTCPLNLKECECICHDWKQLIVEYERRVQELLEQKKELTEWMQHKFLEHIMEMEAEEKKE